MAAYKEKKDKISANAMVYMVGNFFIRAVSILTAPIFTRLLTTQDYGKVSIYMTWVSFFAIFTCLELNGSLNNAYIEFGTKNYKGYIKTCISLMVFVTLIELLTVMLFQRQLTAVFDLDYPLLLLVVVHSFFYGTIVFLSGYLAVLQKAFAYIIASLLQVVFNIVFSILLILYSGNQPAESRIYGQFLACALVGGCIFLFFELNKEKFIQWSYVKYGLVLSVPLIFHALSGIVLSSSDKVMLSRISGDADAGLYSFAVSVLAIINTITNSFNTAWMPYYFETVHEQRMEELKKRTKSYVSCYAILACGFLLVMPEVVKLLADRSYWDCIPVIIPLVIGEFFIFVYKIPVNYEFYKKKNVWIASATVLTALINIGMNAVLIPKYGIYGAVIATVVADIICFVFHYVVAHRMIGDFYFRIGPYIPYFIIVIIASVAAGYGNWMIRWALAAAFGIVLVRRLWKTKRLF